MKKEDSKHMIEGLDDERQTVHNELRNSSGLMPSDDARQNKRPNIRRWSNG